MKELIEENFVYIVCNFSLYDYFYLDYLWTYVAGYNPTYKLIYDLYKLFKKKYGDKIYKFERWAKRRAKLDNYPYLRTLLV